MLPPLRVCAPQALRKLEQGAPHSPTLESLLESEVVRNRIEDIDRKFPALASSADMPCSPGAASTAQELDSLDNMNSMVTDFFNNMRED